MIKHKMAFKLSGFIIGVLIVALTITIFSSFMSGVENAGYDVTYSGSRDANFTENIHLRLAAMHNTSEEIKKDVEAITQDDSWLDKIGGFFSAGWGSLRISLTSFGVFEAMTSDAFNEANLGNNANYIRITLITIVVIALFVGIVISIIVKDNNKL